MLAIAMSRNSAWDGAPQFTFTRALRRASYLRALAPGGGGAVYGGDGMTALPPSFSEPLLVAPSADGAPAAASGRRARVGLLDNAKAVLICCVVLYHTSVVYTSSDRPEAPIAFFSGLLAIMKPVVMPCFCLISGHLSPATLEERHSRALLQLLAVYLIFQGLYFLQKMLAFTLNDFPFQSLPIAFFNPPEQVVTWFLLALLVWRSALPVLLRTRSPLGISLLLGLAANFADLGVNYQNIAAFLPYFVAGAVVPKDAWSLLHRPWLRWPFAALFVASTVGLVGWSAYGGAAFRSAFEQITLTYACFDGNPPSQKALACSTFHELAMRALFYLLSLPLIVGFLCALPRRTSWLTAPGHMSMYVYLLHPLLLYNPWIMKTTFDALSGYYGHEVNVWSPATHGSAFAALLPAALLACAALSLPCTRTLFWPLVEPPIGRLLFDAPAQHALPTSAV